MKKLFCLQSAALLFAGCLFSIPYSGEIMRYARWAEGLYMVSVTFAVILASVLVAATIETPGEAK